MGLYSFFDVMKLSQTQREVAPHVFFLLGMICTALLEEFIGIAHELFREAGPTMHDIYTYVVLIGMPCSIWYFVRVLTRLYYPSEETSLSASSQSVRRSTTHRRR